MPKPHIYFSALAAATMVATAALAGTVFGAGATFPYPLYATWAEAYRKESGVGLNYQSIGSGGGIAQIKAGTVTFGATDIALGRGDLDKIGIVQFPAIIGATVPIVHLDGVAPGRLILSGPVLAGIYRGKIYRWDDPAIKKLNPGLTLPAKAIAVVTRADGSGTAYNFTAYLSRFDPTWRAQVGVRASIDWPVGIGAKGSEGVASMVTRTTGAIGFVEYTFAKQNRLTFTRLINHDGKAVAPTAGGFAAAATSLDWRAAEKAGFSVDLLDRPGAASWPLVSPTYILMRRQPNNAADSKATLVFFAWAFAKGDTMAAKLDYIPLPAPAKQTVKESWKQVRGSGF